MAAAVATGGRFVRTAIRGDALQVPPADSCGDFRCRSPQAGPEGRCLLADGPRSRPPRCAAPGRGEHGGAQAA